MYLPFLCLFWEKTHESWEKDITEVKKDMMNYEMFKGVIETELTNFLPESLGEVEVVIEKVNKVNRELDAVTIKRETDGKQISPTIYLQDMYERYEACDSLPDVMREIADAITKGMEKSADILAKVDIKNADERIIFQLINAEQNQKLLEGVPYRPFQDLAIIYRVVVDETPDAVASAIITNEMAEYMGKSEAELFELAAENTKRINPVKICGMFETLKMTFASQDMPDELIESMLPPMPEDELMYVISNQRNVNGAISMIYEDSLHELAEKLGEDLYILPSSVHEVLAIPASTGEPEQLAEMVYEINMAQVSLEDRLSNQVYHYDRKARKLEMATDTPNKRIDGQVAEQSLVYAQDKKTDAPKR